MNKLIIILVVLLNLISCQSNNSDKLPHKESGITISQDYNIDNVIAFAKVYGYVKCFHPSDEASDINWDKFAIYGVEKVSKAQNTNELKVILEQLFLPIAQTIQIYKKGEKIKEFEFHQDTSNLKIKAWVHKGIELTDNKKNIYKSKIVKTHTKSDFYRKNAGIKFPSLEKRINISISDSLYYYSTIAIPSLKKNKQFKELNEKIESVRIQFEKSNSVILRLADVVIAWNIFQHFYPYFDTIDVEWSDVLNSSIENALSDKTQEEHYYSLRKMIEQLQDGHGMVINRNITNNRYYIPIKVEWIENSVTVTETDNSDLIQVGDVILSVNDTNSIDYLQQIEENISGSPQWKRNISITSDFPLWIKYDEISLEILRSGTIKTIKLKINQRISKRKYFQLFRGKNTNEAITQLMDNIYYIDLRNQNYENEFYQYLDDLSNATGIIFDLRGYPNGKPKFIQHLINETVQSAQWKTPIVMYPDFENVTYDTSGRWTIRPKSPKLRGKIVFLTNNKAISYAESIMGIIEHYKLAYIVGQPSAGANGNVNSFTLPSDNIVRFTGMKVLKHDGSQHHLIGIQPTHPVERTIQGVKEGRDEVLEYAIELINSE